MNCVSSNFYRDLNKNWDSVSGTLNNGGQKYSFVVALTKLYDSDSLPTSVLIKNGYIFVCD